MDITEEEVNDILAKKQREIDEYEKRTASGKNSSEKKDKYAMEDVIEKLNAFVEKQSTYEGAELPKIAKTETKNDKVNLDTKKFMEVMQNTLGIEELEHNDDMEDMDDDDEDVATEEEQKEMRELMEQMDLELAGTTIGESFEKVTTVEEILEKDNKSSMNQSHKKEELKEPKQFKPVDLNMNLVKNLMESISSEHGNAGPYSNLLKEFESSFKKS